MARTGGGGRGRPTARCALRDTWQAKRRIIGQQFLQIQKEQVKKLGLNADKWLLGQGTIYPDTHRDWARLSFQQFGFWRETVF